MNKAIVNEDPNARLINELRAEVAKLKARLTDAADIDVGPVPRRPHATATA